MRPSHAELQARVDAYIEQFDSSIADEKEQTHQQKGQVCMRVCLCMLIVCRSIRSMCASAVLLRKRTVCVPPHDHTCDAVVCKHCTHLHCVYSCSCTI